MSERVKNIDVAQVYKLWEVYATSTNEGNLERWMSLWTEAGIQMTPGDEEIFWRERVRLMKLLVRLRYAQAQRTAF